MIRLDKYLADMGKGTRTQVKEMIRKGRVTVDGGTVKSADSKIDPDAGQVCLDGVPVNYVSVEYYMLYKPAGVVSAVTDRHYRTVVDLIEEKNRKDLFPVGRLDIDTEGLLLITNDGELAHALLSPKKHVDKVYYAELDGPVPEDAAARFSEGLELEDGTKTLPADLELLGPQTVHLTIREGKFHQVKRMFEVLGIHVTYLKRLSMGSLVLDETLSKGGYRRLTAEEIRLLKEGNSSDMSVK